MSRRAAYAERTDVPVERSESEIRALLRRYGAEEFAMGERPRSAMIAFKAHARHVRFELPLPTGRDVADAAAAARKRRKLGPDDAVENALDQERRRRWRALALVIKAKLEAVATGIATFEDEFMAHIIMPGGKTVSELVRPAIEDAYAKGVMQPLLPAWQPPEA